MSLIADIAGQFAGRPVVAMGGGPSLPSDVAVIADAAGWVSANSHGAELRPCDYIVSVDNNHQTLSKADGHAVPMEPLMRRYGLPIIGPRFYSDYRIDGQPIRGNAGIWAIYAAWLLGGWPVIAAGFDCYGQFAAAGHGQAGTYFHDPAAASTGHDKDATHWADRYTALRAAMPGAQVRAVSGPLQQWFPAYDPSETLGEYVAPQLTAPLAASARQRVRVRIRRAGWLGQPGQVLLHRGEDLTLTEAEAHYVIARGIGLEIEQAAA
jgi:hypothetical protein